MPEQVPFGILGPGRAEVCADAPVGGRAVLDRAVLDRHAAKQGKAAAVEHLCAQAIKHRAERREGKIFAANGSKIEAAGAYGARGGFNFGNVGGGQAVGPLGLTRAHVGAGPGGGTAYRLAAWKGGR